MSVGLVLVSHSRRLAEGLRELIEQVAQGQVPIAVAAGAAEGALGTNAYLVWLYLRASKRGRDAGDTSWANG